MLETLSGSRRTAVAAVGLAAALTLAIVVVLPPFAFSPAPSPEIFRKVSAAQLGPGIKLQLAGPADVPTVSQAQARQAVAPALDTDIDEVRLVRFRATDLVPTIDMLAWVFSFKNPPALPSGPMPQTGAARNPTALPPSSTFWMVVIDAQTGQFVTAFGATR